MPKINCFVRIILACFIVKNYFRTHFLQTMKKNIFLVVAAMVAGSTVLLAQPTLTSNFNPTMGATTIIVKADSSGISEGAAGANVTFDFSALSMVGDTITYSYLYPSATPYGTKFPTATLSFLSEDGQGGAGFTYLKTSATGYEIVGVATPNLQLVYSNSQIFAQYPLTYNSTFTDDFAGLGTSAQGVTTYRMGNTSSVADAWGTLKLPQGTFNNVLRIKTIQTSKDSASYMGNSFVFQNNSVSYTFVRDDIQQQLLSITYNTYIEPVSGNETSLKSVTYYPEAPTTGPNSIHSAEKDLTYTVYPNPASQQITITPHTDIKATHYTITDMLGKTQINQNFDGLQAHTADISMLNQGVFILSVYNDGKLLGSQKICVVK
jgi:hypothetical protein